MSKEIKVTVSDELAETIRLYAEYQGRSVSGLLRHCVRSEITRHREPFLRWKSFHTESGGE